MIKTMLVFGTRPEAIKMCPLVLELKKHKNIKTVVVVTGQHREMQEEVMKVFGVEPDYNMEIMEKNQSLYDITTKVLNGMKPILENEKPDCVLVQGDTTSAMAVAMASFYQRIPVGHIEAGLRTYNIYAPYPEEFNRQAISSVSRYHFAPTKEAQDNLLREGKNSDCVFVTGNTVIDAMKYTVSDKYANPEFDWVGNDRLVFITAHRRENIGEPMRRMFRAVRRVIEEHEDVKALYPVHPNPQVRKIAFKEFAGCEKIHLIDPLDVIACHNFESRCFLCLTDSGGIQEECPSFGKPVLVMRDVTERNEGISAGALMLVGTDENKIYDAFSLLLDNKDEYQKMAKVTNPYGDGHACERIAEILEDRLEKDSCSYSGQSRF